MRAKLDGHIVPLIPFLSSLEEQTAVRDKLDAVLLIYS